MMVAQTIDTMLSHPDPLPNEAREPLEQAEQMNEAELIDILRNPAVVKTADGHYDDDAPAIWAWFAHGTDTGMTPFYSLADVRRAAGQVTKPEAA